VEIGVASTIVPAGVDHEVAAEMPWYYMVWTGSGEPPGVTSVEQYEQLSEGGPGSGHHGHKGIPGEHGGSMRSGYAIDGLVRAMMEQGGFTRHIITGDDPTTGYMVSIHEDRERVLALGELDEASLERYIKDNIDLLGQEDGYLGGWAHEGKAYLDALELAKQHAQLAIWGLAEGEEYTVGKETKEAGGHYTSRGSFSGGVQEVDYRRGSYSERAGSERL
jgi:hypothetical protein